MARGDALGALAVTRSMPKSPRDEIGARETWIQDRLGERKYRQLRMHLTGALRLLNELREQLEQADSAQSSGETTELSPISLSSCSSCHQNDRFPSAI